MQPFTYVLPETLAQAAEAARQPDTVLKGAGIDLVDRLKERLQTPAQIVSLLPLQAELAGIAVEADGGLRLGALTTLTQLEQHPALADAALAGLREAAAATASPQVRHRATVAGNMGWSDCVRVHPSNLAPALLALDAEYSTVLDGKVRRRKLADLFPADPRAEAAEHTLAPGEIVTALHLPAQPAGTRSSYCESREKQGFDWATTACAVRVVLDDGTIRAAAVVLGAVAPVPLPRPAARLLLGQKPNPALFQKVADAAFTGASPLAHNGYKVTVGKAVVREALERATR